MRAEGRGFGPASSSSRSHWWQSSEPVAEERHNGDFKAPHASSHHLHQLPDMPHNKVMTGHSEFHPPPPPEVGHWPRGNSPHQQPSTMNGHHIVSLDDPDI